jgi:hypothetical protein
MRGNAISSIGDRHTGGVCGIVKILHHLREAD